MTLSRWFRLQFWVSLFGGGCAVGAFVGCIVQARTGFAVVNVFSLCANAWFAREAWRELRPQRADAARET